MRFFFVTCWLIPFCVFASGLSASAAEDDLPVKARPRMVGEKVPDYLLKSPDGSPVKLASLIKGKFTLLAFVGRIATQESARQVYFNTIRPFIDQLGYQIVVVAAVPPATLVSMSHSSERILLSDENRDSFIDMGLADTRRHDDPVTTGLFLLDDQSRIIFEFASVRNAIAVSGEVLVLAAKEYRDLARKLEKKHTGIFR